MMSNGVADEAADHSDDASANLSESANLIGVSDPGLAAFFSAFTRYASPDDLLLYSGAELAALIRLVYQKTALRPQGETQVFCFDAHDEDQAFSRPQTILVAVNDDMPFLLDSATAEVNAEGRTIRAAFHPVIAASRDAKGARSRDGVLVQESYIVLALDYVADSAKLSETCAALQRVFTDVKRVVRDFPAMLGRMNEIAEILKAHPPEIPQEDLDESLAFLKWLADDHYTFLGTRDYVFEPDGDGRLAPVPESGLGILSDPDARVVRRGSDRDRLTPEIRAYLTRPSPLIIAKSAMRTSVHRRVHMDYVGVKRFDSAGKLIGERRFVGLFTSAAYNQLPSDIPLLRRKTTNVLAGSGLPAKSHDAKALTHILNTFPRDELFQMSEDELLTTSLGILDLGQRPKVRLFLRFDRFDRYVTALVYVPRERYNSDVREKIHAILARTLDGRMSAYYPTLDIDTLARVLFIVGRNEGPRPVVDVKELEAEIREAIRTWDDRFRDAAMAHFGERNGQTLAARYADAFSPSYHDGFDPAVAVEDIVRIEELLSGRAPGGNLSADVYGVSPAVEGGRERLKLKLFVRGDYVPLSDCLPIFENLGLKAIAEDAFALTPLNAAGTKEQVSLQNFVMERSDGQTTDLARIKPLLENAFHAVWLGQAESDGFNRLILAAELPWRDATIVRAVAKYLRQAGLMFSQAYMENALAQNAELALLLVDLFYSLHDPEAFEETEARTKDSDALRLRIDSVLEAVPNADEDRIIRAMLAVIDAMVRTNFFQRDETGATKPALSFKLESRKLAFLPDPKPLFEIYVHARDVEAVHLRFGRVARGGIRWSDRAEDFRTEVLGLVKAQQVKNAVIVPVGAKGGFYPKLLPKSGRDEIQNAAIGAYKTFIGALLDLTDNLGPDGSIIPPERVVRHDDDDPYLVVAADKGTATFSDIANGIALSRGFWLGDAFASGGSKGYDHKKMGITARGAWEAVKRHFRELGRDIQTAPFTTVGVGDMSGDVFGNAMLLSHQTKLVAAFDHRHIFFDPTPDSEISWAERKRLFDLPRSSWADYDKALISPGGGIFPRTAKEISLSKELKAFAGLKKDAATPQELIRALLAAPVDLLFFGGIGTFIKAAAQSHADVGDRSNDALRLNGNEIRASVIGEGANLGVTQLGRIEFARVGGPEKRGGKINTDAIDNSAGVDTSDHEVNLKILMSGAVRRGEMSDATRDATLVAMTDDVAHSVLAHNYSQTLAISVAELCASTDLDAAGRFMSELDRAGKLDRDVEMLPDDEQLSALAREGKGLSRPEIAVLLAYAKLDLKDEVAASALPDDPYFDNVMTSYFPPLAAKDFASELPRHRLRREIVSTSISNAVVDLAGPLFVHRMREISGAPAWSAAWAFALADGAFSLSALKDRIAALDLKVPASIQHRMVADIAQLLRRLGLWFIVQLEEGTPLKDTVAAYSGGVVALKGRLAELVSPLETRLTNDSVTELTKAGVPKDVAEDVAVLKLLGAAPEIVLLAQTHSIPVDVAASAYFHMGALVGFDRLRALSDQVVSADHWDRLALRRTIDDLYAAQRILTDDALKNAGTNLAGADRVKGTVFVRSWATTRQADIARVLAFLDELERTGVPTIAKVALANSQVQRLAGK